MPVNPKYKIVISGTRKHLEQTKELIHFISTQHGLGDADADLVEVAVGEACHNALRYGLSKGSSQDFNLELSFDDELVKAVITDNGEPFNFEDIEPFSIDQDFMIYKNGGLGIPLIKTIMDEVHYVRKPDNTNELTLIKHLYTKVRKGREKNK